ncbi:MAG: FliH/SctL family protein [Chthonomonadales bacterium]
MSSIFRAINGTRSVEFCEVSLVAEAARRRDAEHDELPAEVRRMLEEAQLEAQRILECARAEAEQIRAGAAAEGYSQGYAEGYALGREEGAQSWAGERAAYQKELEDYVAALEAGRKRIWADAEPQIVEFVMETAEKVVKEQAQVDRQIALSVIRHALRRVVDQGQVTIRVNVADIEAVRQSREELAALLDGADRLKIVEDRRVGPGGCIVETDAGTVDARVDTQFEELKNGLDRILPEAA